MWVREGTEIPRQMQIKEQLMLEKWLVYKPDCRLPSSPLGCIKRGQEAGSTLPRKVWVPDSVGVAAYSTEHSLPLASPLLGPTLLCPQAVPIALRLDLTGLDTVGSLYLCVTLDLEWAHEGLHRSPSVWRIHGLSEALR